MLIKVKALRKFLYTYIIMLLSKNKMVSGQATVIVL